MKTAGAEPVGRFNVEVELSNEDDLTLAQAGHLDPAKVRRLTLEGVVDSGAARLVIPAHAAKKLGLREAGKVRVRYADRRTAMRPRVEKIRLKLQGRDSVFAATVEPKRDTALIGAIVLEELDFLVDCTKGRLYPRDPDYVVSEEE